MLDAPQASGSARMPRQVSTGLLAHCGWTGSELRGSGGWSSCRSARLAGAAPV